MTEFSTNGWAAPVTGRIDDAPDPVFGWRRPIVEWPHPDGSTVTLAIDYPHAIVYVEHAGDVQYGDAWCDQHLAVGAPARARSGHPAAAWLTIVNPTRFHDIATSGTGGSA